MKKLLLFAGSLVLLTGISTASQAQAKRLCGAALLQHQLAEKNGITLAELHQKADAYLAAHHSTVNAQAKGANTVVTIPVVFHVILDAAQITQLGGQAGIIARINTQMAVLNEDYSASNLDSSHNPAAFKPVFGNMQMQFRLTGKTPAGLASPGYEIKTTTVTSFSVDQGTTGSGYGVSDAKYAAGGGLDSWDPTKYLNVWIVNTSGFAGLLGITAPQSFVPTFGFPQAEVGVVLNYPAFGRRTSSSQYFYTGIDKGRTLTHEIGHIFELEHTWGDDEDASSGYNSTCPSSGGHDDGISDTPPQAVATYCNNGVCPHFPLYDSCTATGNGIMFMNYMDYVDDSAMHMFTKQQVIKSRQQVDAGGESHTLTTHPELLAVNDVAAVLPQVSVLPNPTNGRFEIYIPATPEILSSITVLNTMGQVVLSIPIRSSGTYAADLSGMSSGLYYLRCQFGGGAVTRKILLQ